MSDILLVKTGQTHKVTQPQLDCLKILTEKKGRFVLVFYVWEQYQSLTKKEGRPDEGHTSSRMIANDLDDLFNKKIIERGAHSESAPHSCKGYRIIEDFEIV